MSRFELYWLTPTWWRYVLDDSGAHKEYGPLEPYFWGWSWPWSDDYIMNPFAGIINYLDRCECRATGHPKGVHWYSSGSEPDMTCKGCGEDLG